MDQSFISVQLIKGGVVEQLLLFCETPEKDSQIAYQGILRIGRMSTSHIRIDDPDMPRLHSTIENHEGIFSLMMMGASKTLYNGTDFSGKIELKEGDEITIGDWTLKFFPQKDLSLISTEPTDDLEDEDLPFENDETSGIREVISTIPSSSVKSANSLLDNSTESHSEIQRRAEDRISNPYFNLEPEDGILLQKVVGKGLEIKHYWQGNMMSAILYKTPKIVTIGEDPNDDFYVTKENLPNNKSFTISDPSNEKGFNVYFLLNGVKYIEGSESYNLEELLQAHKAATKSEYHGAIRLIHKTKIAFETGDHRFEISSVPVLESSSKFSLFGLLDSFNLKFNVVSTLFHLALLALLFLMPPDIESFSIEQLNEIPDRYARVILDTPEEEKVKPVVKFDVTDTKLAKTEFTANNKNSKNVEFNATNFNVAGLTQKQVQDKRIVRSTGIFKVGKSMGGLGGGGTYGGIQDDDLRLSDNSDISSGNSGAPGIRGGGTGPGGGGTGLGAGGPATGGGNWGGGGNIGISNISNKKVNRKLKITTDSGSITGNLTKEQIQRVVNKHLMEVRYCYEKELTRKPELAGSITVKWKINPQGEVVAANIDGGTLKDNAVQSCLVQRIKKWRFPEPLGGGFALVIFPFNFHSN
ncbi:AgmX/PglI C-terminal domain-containing protein [bacterium]|nr:AgmX/PglI C-terminal domain-containing protein [bacterium]